MSRTPARIATWMAAVCATALAPATALEPGGDVSVSEDLSAVLALRGKPCDAIASHRRRAEADYQVTCTSGERYRIYVDGERLEIEELPPGPGPQESPSP